MTTKASDAHIAHPALYQINTRVWLTALARTLGDRRPLTTFRTRSWIASPASVSTWIWLLGVWQTGLAGQPSVRAQPGVAPEFPASLPDLREEDVCRVWFRHPGYHGAYGTSVVTRALARLRTTAQQTWPETPP